MLSPLSNGLVAVALVAGSCSGTGEGDNPTAPTSMATPPTTVVVATTAAPTTAAPTTLAPTTTIDPIEAEKAAVAAAVVQARIVRNHAFENLDDAAAQAAIDEWHVPGSPVWINIQENLDLLRERGYRVRPNPDLPESFTVAGVQLLDGPSSTRAEATVCVIDTAVVFEPEAGPNGEDTIVNDDIFASRVVYTLEKSDQGWRVFEVSSLEDLLGATECSQR